jgi:hypothetical protein
MAGAGWVAVSGGLLQEMSRRLAQTMPTTKMRKRNMARRITEGTGKIKQAKQAGHDFSAGKIAGGRRPRIGSFSFCPAS